MTCKAKDYRGFCHMGEAYYHKGDRALRFPSGVVDQVCFGLSCGDGGTHGEMLMEFSELGGKVIPQLKVYDDGWIILSSFTDLLAELAKENRASISVKSITPKEFCAILLRCGFKDKTPYENPNLPETIRVPALSDYREALCSIADIAHKALGIERLS